jgi:uncharacterized UBP type Zn finger protein
MRSEVCAVALGQTMDDRNKAAPGAVEASVTSCTHLPAPQATPRATTCERCGAKSSLRMCAHCGFVGCCESQSAHNREHALGARHPVIRSLPLTERSFTWCYDCGDYV